MHYSHFQGFTNLSSPDKTNDNTPKLNFQSRLHRFPSTIITGDLQRSDQAPP